MRYFGKEGLINRLREHIRLARLLESFVEESQDFRIMAPVPFSVVCFRYEPEKAAGDEKKLELFNSELMDRVNKTGKLYISHTKLKGKYVLRFAIGNFRTTEEHIKDAWNLITENAEEST